MYTGSILPLPIKEENRSKTSGFLHIGSIFAGSTRANHRRRIEIRLDGNLHGFRIRLRRSRRLRRRPFYTSLPQWGKTGTETHGVSNEFPCGKHHAQLWMRCFVYIGQGGCGAAAGASRRPTVCTPFAPIGRGRRLDDPFITNQKAPVKGALHKEVPPSAFVISRND